MGLEPQDLHEKLGGYFEARFGENLKIGLITGSVAAGVANSRSDLDLVIVLDDCSALIDGDCGFKAFNIEGMRADTLIMTQACLKRVISLIPKQSFKDYTKDNMCVEKLMNADVVFGHDAYEDVIDDTVALEFRKRLFLGQRQISWGIFDDYIGMCLEKNDVGRVEMLQALVRNELECFLIQSGSTFRKTKWISKKLEALGQRGDPYTKFYRDTLLTVPSLDEPALTNWEADVWNFQRKIQLNFLFEDLADKVLTGSAPCASDEDTSAMRYLIVGAGGRYFLQNVNGNYELSLAATRIAATRGILETSALRRALGDIGDSELRAAEREVSLLFNRA
ncbi:hypothetical protein KUV51_18785 [Tateyamaria omphalii]|uniref:hypothetical protein n=1 Tax=Tateyamaria omphalii TaxID=299262 RepID=UPI001C99AAA8|nr:hypothetical protein [Tateyamaria omphalii]MBY5935058.1 hypothetical protein [Tateyamaria omphalii]